MGLLETLGLTKAKVRAGKPAARVAAGDAPDKVAAPAPDGAMAQAATQYAAAKQAAIDSLATLTGAFHDAERARLQTQHIDAAAQRAKAGDFAAGTALLAQVPGKVADAKAALAKKQSDFETAYKAVVAQVEALRKHPQKGKITAGIAAAETELGKARAHADKNEFTQAEQRLKEAKKQADAAAKLADRHADFAKDLTQTRVILFAWKGVADDAFAEQQKQVDAAAKSVQTNPPQFDTAKATLKAVRDALGKKVLDWYVTPTRQQIKDLKAKPAAAFIQDELKAIDAGQAEVEANAKAQAWSKAILGGRAVDELILMATKMADRRVKFDTQRAKARTALDALKAHAAMKARSEQLEKDFAAADALADKKVMRFEDGTTALESLTTSCTLLSKAGDGAQAYERDRADADKRIAAAEALPTAKNLAQPIAAAKAMLKEAADTATQAATAPDPGPVYATARASVARALTALADLEKLGTELGPVVQARDAAVAAKDATAIRASITTLKKQAEAALKQPHADAADSEFKRYAVAVNEADAALGDREEKHAADALKDAAEALMAARTVQVEHGRGAAQLKALEDRRKLLLSRPTAKAIQARIDAIAAPLAAIQKADAARDWPGLALAVGQGQAAADAAEAALEARTAYERRLKEVEVDAGKLADADTKKRYDELIARAATEADALAFDKAQASLNEADVVQESEDLAKLAKSNPNSAALVASARKMIAKGGEKALDDLVKQLPDSTPDSVIADLLKLRFGQTLTVAKAKASDVAATGKPDPAGEATKSAKKIYEMLAKVPEDVIKNPSLRKIQRVREFKKRDDDPTKKREVSGGAYSGSGNEITMNGRPDISKQKFGSGLGGQLPADVEEDCKPKDEAEVDYFDFATLHEVGHAVDDATNFMVTHTGAEYGGWITHGANVEPIAAAAAAKTGYDKTPEQLQYVLDLILGNNPDPLVHEGPDKAAADTAKTALDDWYKKATSMRIWWSHSDSESIKCKDERIYHEAYPRVWVSYLAAARKKGLTGYQFRAPGEWFAELYAAYRSDKLGDKHPARAWLSKLSV